MFVCARDHFLGSIIFPHGLTPENDCPCTLIKMQKERLVLQMKPKYDKTKGQILILPSFNSFRRLDPQTRFYSDFIPTGTTTKGVDFTSDRLELLDLAYTFICTKQKLLPTHPSSSRERVLNILKRRFIKEKRNIQFVNPKYYSE
jgi:hypothetical protein